ncbi:MAG: M6 family metalloprotease domain-containing protein [Prevotella sp.]|nr:M6 family metalloprotease domain-containing protein [Prevotella sp.]
MSKVITALLLFFLLPLTVLSQGNRFLRYDCMAVKSEGSQPSAASRPLRLPTINTQWDSTRVYPVAVVLLSFSDQDFSVEDPADRYQRMFNEKGYNEGVGPGCITDYFQEQSAGRFNPRFDIYGPVRITKTRTGAGTYGESAFREAAQLLVDSLGVDFSPYDWDGDSISESFIFVYAGYGGNENVDVCKGSIWPNTGYFSSVKSGGTTLRGYSSSAELWSNDASCGIGTICHEFTHTLGLPDLYPTSGDEYSVCDEWDLMDGGNYINEGWCPPCFSAHSKMLLGWGDPEPLDAAATIVDMEAISEGGKAYIVTTDEPNEFFILENRQWRGWDLRVPGHGLLITHVDYNASSWKTNTVNTNQKHHRYEYVHADNMDYNQWTAQTDDHYLGGHNLYLSTSPYPLVNDTVENREFTDASIPAAVTYGGTGLLSKPLTQVTESNDTISFLFMGGDPTGISELANSVAHGEGIARDPMGRPVGRGYRGLVIKNGRKFVFH